MIYSLTANKSSFKTINFHKGLNLILGVKAEGSSATDTCNSLGKSTALHIIDFCLGSDAKKNNWPKGKLPGWEFTLELDVGASRVKVTRATDAPNIISVVGDVTNLPIQPNLTLLDGTHQYDLEEWRKLLGFEFFGLPTKNDDEEDHPQPSYRQLFAYFFRKSFDSPLNPITNIKAVERDRSITYLLGLEWEFFYRLSDVEDKKKGATAVRDAVKVKLHEWGKKITEVRAECKTIEKDLKEYKRKLESFKVDPAYHQHEENASKLTNRIHELRNQIFADKRNLMAAKKSLSDETEDSDAVIRLYEDAKAALSDAVKKHITDVQRFHAEVSNNRKEFLQAEITRLTEQIKANEAESKRLDEERAQCLQYLKTSGALEEFVELQNAYLAKRDALAEKKICIEEYEKSRMTLDALKKQKENVIKESKAEFERRNEMVVAAENQFLEIVRAFYSDTDATLGIEFKNKGKKPGYKFKPSVKGDDGHGIGKILAFIFDMSLFLRNLKCGRTNRLLIHDGEMFASPDNRQKAIALEMAHKLTTENNAQYITGMNEDSLLLLKFSDGFNLESCVALRLYDGTVEGKLLGIDF